MAPSVATRQTARSEGGAWVWPVFARQKVPMGLVVRTIRLARATVKIDLANLAPNICRMIWLVVGEAARARAKLTPPSGSAGVLPARAALAGSLLRD